MYRQYCISGESIQLEMSLFLNSGQLLNSGNREITYTAFQKTASITDITHNLKLDIDYGISNQRIRSRFYNNNQLQRTNYYAANYEKIVEGNNTREINYISTPYGTIAVYVKENSNAGQMFYLYKDHLGSITKITNTAGNTVFSASYDAWGKQTITNNTFKFSRGFTGHEHLTDFQLINMNGRMYDPLLGRFLSPDPYVPNMEYSQDFNRYSYARNNPLSYIDPTGEIVWFVPVIVGAVVGAYVGASIQSGTVDCTKWKSDSWKGAIVGGIVGAGIGFLGAAALPSFGVNVTTASGATAFGSGSITTSTMSITSHALLSGNIAIASNYAQGRGLEGAWKAGLIGLGTGALAASLQIGLTSDNIISKSGDMTYVKLFDNQISAIAQATGGAVYGATDRYIRLREEGVRGWELFGYSFLGLIEGAGIGALSGGAYFSNPFLQTGFTSLITSVPGLGYSIMDVQTLCIFRIGGLHKYIGEQVPKYPKVLSIDQIVSSLFKFLKL